jgi:hypothetical protein
MYRTGRKLGRTIYRQYGDDPSDEDIFWGIMDTPEQARITVASLNRFFDEVWSQPMLEQTWRLRGDSSVELRIADIRADGKYVCRKLDDHGYKVVSADDLNIDYYKVS